MTASKLIVPIGWRREAERIAPMAAEIAGDLGVAMEFVHVAPSWEAPLVRERNDRWMTSLAERVGATVRRVDQDSVPKGLIDVLVDQPDAVVCMAVESDGGPLDPVLGSISGKVLRAGHHQCVLVGPEVPSATSATSGPIVVCLDGSDHSESILPVAASWASLSGATIWVVAVLGDDTLPPDIEESAYVERTARVLGTRSEWEVLHGRDPAQAVIDFAEKVGATSICMATHGRSGLGRVALGSVTLRVVHSAPCPVITRRPPALSSVVGG